MSWLKKQILNSHIPWIRLLRTWLIPTLMVGVVFLAFHTIRSYAVLPKKVERVIISYPPPSLPQKPPAAESAPTRTTTPPPSSMPSSKPPQKPSKSESQPSESEPSLLYSFNNDGILEEAPSITLSSSPYFWLDSGGQLSIREGVGTTIQGALPDNAKWRIYYNQTNPVDTDNGYFPQNIFRLVTRSTWQNSQAEAYFVINATNNTKSPNRNASNGLLIFSRYKDSENLYYTGIRVDGAAVIKKKLKGTYSDLAYIPGVFSGEYDGENLIPQNTWIGLRSEIKNLSDGTVQIRLYIDMDWKNTWHLIAEAIDRGQDGAPITDSGHSGIRTDFMDVSFENFHITSL
jgi:hypothetical protein